MYRTHRWVAASAVLLAAVAARVGAADRPNIVFIFSDDHAAQAISAYGSEINRTPNIDRLAREGVRFANCFAGNAICAPSRATVLTGVHSHVNGIRDNGDIFDGSQPTVASLLQGAGYQTAVVGKWHLKSDPVGFDHWAVYPGQGHYYNPVYLTPEGRKQVEGYSVTITTDKALSWLEAGRDKDKPFLLMLQYKAPHRNWMPGPDYLDLYADVEIAEPATLFDDHAGLNEGTRTQEMEIDRHMMLDYDLKAPPSPDPETWRRMWRNLYDRMTDEQRAAWDRSFEPRNESFRAQGLEGRELVRWKYQRYIKDYLRCVAAVDHAIGRVLAALEAQGLQDDTIVVYSSDQGFFLGEHGWYDKRWMYEESLRMPLLVRWPGVTRAGHVCRDLVQNIDFAPTLLDAAGVDIPERMQGASAVPLLRGERPDDWRTSIYYRYYEANGPHKVPEHFGIRTMRHKLIRYPELDTWELFDLVRDPDELNNVYGDPEQEVLTRALKKRLDELQVHYGDTP
jgi:arylsulfatase A-like enzyme